MPSTSTTMVSITAGIGPLLFVQLLYQRRFYTANLLMGPRWGAAGQAAIPLVAAGLALGWYVLKGSSPFAPTIPSYLLTHVVEMDEGKGNRPR